MSINRRDFLRVIGVTGAALATGNELTASPSADQKDPVEFRSILYDISRCAGCRSCEYSCAEENHLPPPPDDATGIRTTDEVYRTVVSEYQTSKGPLYLKSQCMHCNEPACAAACLTKAMLKTKEGPVIWRGEKCMGCRYCMVSCPFDVPKFEYFSPNPKIQKCTMCYEKRVKEGKMPACVENCPNEALMFGTRREMIHEAKKRIIENPETYVDHIYGEHEAGGTSFLYISPVPFEEMGLKTSIQKTSYPSLTKAFLYSVPTVFVVMPALLMGIHKATKNNLNSEKDDNEK